MIDYLTTQRKVGKPVASDDTLKLTTLLYLKEALEQERYETCAELIQEAKKFGADTSEVSQVIAGYIGKLSRLRKSEANQRLRRF